MDVAIRPVTAMDISDVSKKQFEKPCTLTPPSRSASESHQSTVNTAARLEVHTLSTHSPRSMSLFAVHVCAHLTKSGHGSLEISALEILVQVLRVCGRVPAWLFSRELNNAIHLGLT